MAAAPSAPSLADLRQQALQHVQQGDLEAATQAWNEIRTRFPDEPAGYLGLARAFRTTGRLDEADSLLSEAAAKFTENTSIVLESARVADAQQQWQKAAYRWRTAAIHQPHEPRHYSNAAAALRRAGRLEEAEKLLAEATVLFPGDLALTRDFAALASARQDWPEAVRRWQAVIKCQPSDARVYLAAATALRHAGRLDEAELVLGQATKHASEDGAITLERARLASARLKQHTEALVALRRTGSMSETASAIAAARIAVADAQRASVDSGPILRLEFQIALASGDWQSIRDTAERTIALDAHPGAYIYADLAHACWQTGDTAAAERAALRAIEIEPENKLAALILAWTTAEQGDPEAALSRFRQLAVLAPDNARWSMEIVRVLHLSGRTEEAAAELDRIKGRWPQEPLLIAWQLNHGIEQADAEEFAANPAKDRFAARMAQELEDIKAVALSEGALGRPLVVDDRSKDILVAQAPGAEIGALIFTNPHDHLTVPVPLFDHYLAALGVSAIYLKDFERLAYLNGIRSFGSYDATIAGLQQLVRQLGIKHLRTLGVLTSGAIRYGVELGAACAVGFDIITTSGLRPAQLTPFGNMVRTRLVANETGQDIDLRSFLRTRQHNCKVKLVYSKNMPFMATQAERMADLPGVELYPQADVNQRVLRVMAAKPHFAETLRALLQLPDRR